MEKIKHLQGNLFDLIPPDNNYKIIPHIVNDIGQWGSGFVIAVSKHWPLCEQNYRRWYDQRDIGDGVRIKFDDAYTENWGLGANQYVWPNRPKTEPIDCHPTHRDAICVVNMIAQHETIRQNDKPIRYAALIQCMAGIRDHVLARNKVLQWHGQQSQIHCPKFGSDRARGSWEFIEELIDELWCANNIPVTVYQL